MHMYMCPDRQCPARFTCKRKLDKPEVGQKWFETSPRQLGHDICEYYWPTSSSLEQVKPKLVIKSKNSR